MSLKCMMYDNCDRYKVKTTLAEPVKIDSSVETILKHECQIKLKVSVRHILRFKLEEIIGHKCI